MYMYVYICIYVFMYICLYIYLFLLLTEFARAFADSLQVLMAVQTHSSSSLKLLTESKLDFTKVM